MSSWIKGIAAGGQSGQSGQSSKGGKQGSTSPGFFKRTNDKNNKGGGKSNNKQEESGFAGKMLAMGKDVQSKRDQQRKEQELIDKKMAKRGVKANPKADVPNGPSKTKLLTSVLGKSK